MLQEIVKIQLRKYGQDKEVIRFAGGCSIVLLCLVGNNNQLFTFFFLVYCQISDDTLFFNHIKPNRALGIEWAVK